MSRVYNERERCHFYYKVGACRHGNKCAKEHIAPTRSRTILVHNMVVVPANGFDPDPKQEFDSIYEDIYVELCKFGKLQAMFICENGNYHLRGNVYAAYESFEDAQSARDNLNTRWYDERPLYCELTHITDLNDAICSKHDTKTCERGHECNFLHVKRPSCNLLQQLQMAQAKSNQLQKSKLKQ